MALACLLVASCGSIDAKSLAEKVEKTPSAITQKDYSQMIDYLDGVVSDSQKLEKMNNMESLNEPFYTFMSVLSQAALSAADSTFRSEADVPELNKENLANYKKLEAKMSNALKMGDY